jgi:AcrR family transcriptional regulator
MVSDMAKPTVDEEAGSLRDRKRERTRRAIVQAATELFEQRGYDETTIADIAAAADIGARTFFSYFASKEEVLFPDSDARVRATVDAIARRGPDDRPADLLLRALRQVGEVDSEIVSRTAALRMRLTMTVPAVRGRALQVQLAAQREIARRLHAAYPDELDEVTAAALVGAFVGAITAALQVLLDGSDGSLDDSRELRAQLNRATDLALRPWLHAAR